MIRPSKYGLSALVIAATLGVSSAAQAQSASAGDASRGYHLFIAKSCGGCHSIGGGKRAGPDLKGVTDRRSKAWLVEWLTHTKEMILTDSTAIGLWRAYNGYNMPEQRMTKSDINDILAYIECGNGVNMCGG